MWDSPLYGTVPVRVHSRLSCRTPLEYIGARCCLRDVSTSNISDFETGSESAPSSLSFVAQPFHKSNIHLHVRVVLCVLCRRTMALSNHGLALSMRWPHHVLDMVGGITQSSLVLQTIALYLMIVSSTIDIRPQFRMSSPDTRANK
jgi:hypothetical protein